MDTNSVNSEELDMERFKDETCLWLWEGEKPNTPYYVAQSSIPKWFSLFQDAPIRTLDTGSIDDLPRLLEACKKLNESYDYSIEATILRIKTFQKMNELDILKQERKNRNE